jgi:hypothetical protein
MQRQILLGHAPRRHPIRIAVKQAAAIERKRREDSDIKLFALSFTAFFVCFYTFLM